MQALELLAPARDTAAAQAAILCGADAVYIGAPQFSARQAAGNSIDDIRRVVELAHLYYVRVYVALNTLLTDAELPQTEAIINDLSTVGIDGLIIQDVGLLELDLPPIPLIASTQMHNNTPEKVKFLEEVGFSRVILARELTLEQIADIRRQTTIELECFIHGALCVSQSGRCAMSYALGGRSGNRGQCAQPCRRRYTLKNGRGQTLCKDRYLLSLKDLNLSARLDALLDAGVTSFKIEGRLKDAAYVANTVGFYRQTLDGLLAKKRLKKSSSGTISLHFSPDPARTFNRGFTEYALADKTEPMGSIDTPKSLGQRVGAVTHVDAQSITLDGNHDLHNGDGLCFFDSRQNLCGTQVNRVEGQKVFVQSTEGLRQGMTLYRNYDHAFIKRLEQDPAERKIELSMTLRDTHDGVELVGVDEDGNTACFAMAMDKQPAQKIQQAQQTIDTQLKKLGNTPYVCTQTTTETKQVYFFPISTLNALKRGLIDAMTAARAKNRPQPRGGAVRNAVPYPQMRLTWRDNVLNAKAAAFYRRHGVTHIEPAAESGLDLHGQTVMTTRYCLRRQLGLCEPNAAPLWLHDEDGRQFRVRFLCGACGMELDWI